MINKGKIPWNSLPRLGAEPEPRRGQTVRCILPLSYHDWCTVGQIKLHCSGDARIQWDCAQYQIPTANWWMIHDIHINRGFQFTKLKEIVFVFNCRCEAVSVSLSCYTSSNCTSRECITGEAREAITECFWEIDNALDSLWSLMLKPSCIAPITVFASPNTLPHMVSYCVAICVAIDVYANCIFDVFFLSRDECLLMHWQEKL